MNKFKNVSKRLVVFLVLFSFLVGLLPLNFNTETVYAAKDKKNGTCYLFIVDSDATAKALSSIGVSDSSKAKILIYNAGKDYDFNAASKNDSFKKALKKVKKVKQGAVIFFPSLSDVPSKAYTQANNNSSKHLTLNLLGTGTTIDHYGSIKAKHIKLFIDGLADLNKAKTKIIYKLPIPTVTSSAEFAKATVISKENSCFSNYFSSNKTKFSVESNPCSSYTNYSTLVSSLKAKDKTTFKYLAYGKDVDEKGNMASSDSSGDSSGDSDDNNVYTTSNDGTVKDKDHLFGDSGAPARYTMDGAKYYDVAVPYNTSIKHIGGYATSATTKNKNYHYIGSTNDWANKQNGLFNRYNDGPGGLSSISSKYTKFGYDANVGGLSYIMADGVKFYCAGIGQGLYANSAWGLKVNKNGEPNWNPISDLLNGGTPCQSGLFFDLLLKDGTQIHFVACDFIGAVHSIGGADSKQDGITYTHSKLNCKQYLTMWHCDSPWHMVEYSSDGSGSPEKIREKLGISKDNPVMYLRVWDASLYRDSGHITVASGMKEGTSKGSALSDAADGSNPDKKEVSDKYMKGYYDESELSAWTKIINESYIGYKSVTRNELNQSELSSLSRWETNVKYDDLENHGVFHIFRWLFMVTAILMMIWSVLLYCAYWMDKVNPFCLPFSFVSILTLGRLETAPTEEECNFTTRGLFKEKDTKSKFINHKYMLFVCLSLIFFSVLILTGTLYKIILTVIGFVAGIFGF